MVEKPTVQTQVREGVEVKTPERTTRKVYISRDGVVEQIEEVRRVLGRDVYVMTRTTYVAIPAWDMPGSGADFDYLAIIESYNSETGRFEVRIVRLDPEDYRNRVTSLLRKPRKRKLLQY